MKWTYRQAFSEGNPVCFVIQDAARGIADVYEKSDAAQIVSDHNAAEAMRERLEEVFLLLEHYRNAPDFDKRVDMWMDKAALALAERKGG